MTVEGLSERMTILMIWSDSFAGIWLEMRILRNRLAQRHLLFPYAIVSAICLLNRNRFLRRLGDGADEPELGDLSG